MFSRACNRLFFTGSRVFSSTPTPTPVGFEFIKTAFNKDNIYFTIVFGAFVADFAYLTYQGVETASNLKTLEATSRASETTIRANLDSSAKETAAKLDNSAKETAAKLDSSAKETAAKLDNSAKETAAKLDSSAKEMRALVESSSKETRSMIFSMMMSSNSSSQRRPNESDFPPISPPAHPHTNTESRTGTQF
jgi:dipeptidase